MGLVSGARGTAGALPAKSTASIVGIEIRLAITGGRKREQMEMRGRQEVQDLIVKGAAIEMMAIPDGEYNSQMFKLFKEMRKALIVLDTDMQDLQENFNRNDERWQKRYDRLNDDFRHYRARHPETPTNDMPTCEPVFGD